MSLQKKNLGAQGEQIASDFLTSKGYKIIERNYRAKQYGEVDIICVHPDQQTLVFVEVKTRISDEFGRPEEAITPGKLRELKMMVDYYFNSFPEVKLSPQIDVVAIKLDSQYKVESLEHFENVTL